MAVHYSDRQCRTNSEWALDYWTLSVKLTSQKFVHCAVKLLNFDQIPVIAFD